MNTLTQRWKEHVGWMAALFLTGLGAKLGLILAFSSPFPYLDQWPGEAVELFIPYLSNHYSPTLLFQPHNEHRIVFTRIVELLLLVANGQWDSQLEMLVNAVIQCASVAVIGGLLASLTDRRYRPFLWLALTLVVALPFGWENALWGFQSQFYFVIFFSLVAIWGLGLHEVNSGNWRLGALAALAAPFAMASGFLAAAAVVGVKLLEIARQRKVTKGQMVTVAVSSVVAVFGALLIRKEPSSEPIYAHSISDFLIAFGKNMAWPWPLHPWYAVFNLVPIVVVGWRFIQRRNEPTALERMIMGMGIWMMLQGAATAYARGTGGMTPSWRYMDALAFLMVANVLSIFVLLEDFRKAPVRVGWRPTVSAIWLAGCLAGLWNLSSAAWRTYIPQLQREQREQLQVSREFLAKDDPRVFGGKSSEQLPVVNVEADVWLLRHPLVRGILPPCAFDTPRAAGRLSAMTARVLGTWKFLLAAGIGWFIFNLLRWAQRGKLKDADGNGPETVSVPPDSPR